MNISRGRGGRRGRLAGLVASLAVAGLVAGACSSGGGDEAASTETEAAAETSAEETAESSGDPIRIGISLPLTGDFSQPGGAAKKGYEVWQTLTNEAGGMLGRPVELVILDDASSQEQVVTDYNRLINEEKVDLLLGTFSSLLNFPASAVAENNKYVLIAPAGGSPTIFEQNFKYYFFAQQAIAPDQGNEFVAWVESLGADGPKTAAFVTQDDPFAAPVIAAMQEKMEALGIETVYSEIYPPETTNFQPIASAIAAAKPDLVAQGAVFEDGVNLVKSMIQLDFNPSIMFQTSAPSNGAQYSDAIGVENTEGIFYAVSWTEKADTPGNAEFVAEYQAQFGEGLVPEEDAADAYAAAEVLQAAVEATGGLDNTAIMEWLHANSVSTILGELSWDEIGRPQGEFLLAQWQNGEVEIVRPEAVATNPNVVYPKPAWK